MTMASFRTQADWSFLVSGIAAGIQLGRTGSCKVTVPVELADHWSVGKRIRANDIDAMRLDLEVIAIRHHSGGYLELTLKIADETPAPALPDAKVEIEFIRGRDGVQGPTLGPFDYAQVVYEVLTTSPDGVELACLVDGDWHLNTEHPMVKEAGYYSDFVIRAING